MLLTIDIGNTNITMGVFEEEFLLGMFRMTTKRARTSDEYGFTICGILEHRGIDSKQIDSVIVASVVPDIMHSFTSGIIKYLGTEPMIVSSQTDTGVRVVTENPTRTESSMRQRGMLLQEDLRSWLISERLRRMI